MDFVRSLDQVRQDGLWSTTEWLDVPPGRKGDIKRREAIGLVMCHMPEDDYAALMRPGAAVAWCMPPSGPVCYPFRYRLRAGSDADSPVAAEVTLVFISPSFELLPGGAVAIAVAEITAYMVLERSVGGSVVEIGMGQVQGRVEHWGLSDGRKNGVMLHAWRELYGRGGSGELMWPEPLTASRLRVSRRGT